MTNEQNRKLVEDYMNAWAKADENKLDQLIDERYKFNNPPPGITPDKQGAIEMVLRRLAHHTWGIAIGSLHDHRPIAVREQRLPGRRHRRCVTIQPDDPPIRCARFKDGQAVPSCPDRPVEIDPSSPWLQPSQHFVQHHRAVHDCNPEQVPLS